MSMFQTLGLNSGKVRPLWEKGGPAISWLIFLGYASIPVAVYAGLVKIIYELDRPRSQSSSRSPAKAAPAQRPPLLRRARCENPLRPAREEVGEA